MKKATQFIWELNSLFLGIVVLLGMMYLTYNYTLLICCEKIETPEVQVVKPKKGKRR